MGLVWGSFQGEERAVWNRLPNEVRFCSIAKPCVCKMHVIEQSRQLIDDRGLFPVNITSINNHLYSHFCIEYMEVQLSRKSAPIMEHIHSAELNDQSWQGM